MNVYLDIETLPCSSPALVLALKEEASAEKSAVRAPSNYKDQEKIDAYIAAKHAEIDAEFYAKLRKTSFDGMYGSIACICYAFDDGEVFSVDVNSSGSESAMLERFYCHILDMSRLPYKGGMADIEVTFVGHNVAGFDLPFIRHRSIILGVRPPLAASAEFNEKKWDKNIADTMLMWSPEREKRVSLDKLCKALGLKGKSGFDGSMVADTWPVDPVRVIEYCKDDVRLCRDVFKRLTFESLPNDCLTLDDQKAA